MIVNDKREIKTLEIAEFCSWTVGKNGVTKIKPYHENGEMAAVVWFEVTVNGNIIHRVNGKQVTIVSYEYEDMSCPSSKNS